MIEQPELQNSIGVVAASAKDSLHNNEELEVEIAQTFKRAVGFLNYISADCPECCLPWTFLK